MGVEAGSSRCRKQEAGSRKSLLQRWEQRASKPQDRAGGMLGLQTQIQGGDLRNPSVLAHPCFSPFLTQPSHGGGREMSCQVLDLLDASDMSKWGALDIAELTIVLLQILSGGSGRGDHFCSRISGPQGRVSPSDHSERK